MIIRISERTEPGSILLDQKGRGVARVIELIGPVSRPYASAAPMSDRIAKDDKVFLSR